jgi:hypothetical protein
MSLLHRTDREITHHRRVLLFDILFVLLSQRIIFHVSVDVRHLGRLLRTLLPHGERDGHLRVPQTQPGKRWQLRYPNHRLVMHNFVNMRQRTLAKYAFQCPRARRDRLWLLDHKHGLLCHYDEVIIEGTQRICCHPRLRVCSEDGYACRAVWCEAALDTQQALLQLVRK